MTRKATNRFWNMPQKAVDINAMKKLFDECTRDHTEQDAKNAEIIAEAYRALRKKEGTHE